MLIINVRYNENNRWKRKGKKTKIKRHQGFKDLIPDDLKSFLVYKLFVLAVVLAILV